MDVDKLQAAADRLRWAQYDQSSEGHDEFTSDQSLVAQWAVTELERRDSEDRLRKAVLSQLADVTQRIANGRGKWPDKAYVTDDTWAEWIGQLIVLRRVLTAAGIDPDEELKGGAE